jgi:hypothetical protein
MWRLRCDGSNARRAAGAARRLLLALRKTRCGLMCAAAVLYSIDRKQMNMKTMKFIILKNY